MEISEGQVSNLLIKKQAEFHQESAEVYDAGLRSSPWQHTDDTLTRVNGQNQHCHVVCNPVYTAYHTRPTKERLSVLDILRQGRTRIFRLNEEALGYVANLNCSKKAWQGLRNWAQENGEQDLEEAHFLAKLDAALPKLSVQCRKALIDAAAIAAYHAWKLNSTACLPPARVSGEGEGRAEFFKRHGEIPFLSSSSQRANLHSSTGCLK